MLNNDLIDYNDLDCYFLNDQPTTCDLCGGRTAFEEINDTMQLHKCLNSDCGYKFITEEDKNPF